MRTYDPSANTMSFAGFPLDGFGKGTLIKASRNEDLFTIQIGNSGSGGRSQNPDQSGTVEATFMNTSPSISILEQLIEDDEDFGTGVGSLLVKDRSTDQAQCYARNAFIKKAPDYERQKEIGEITWIWSTEKLVIRHGEVTDIEAL